MKAIKLTYNNIKLETIKNILKPTYIYIPLYSNTKCLVKKDMYVYKGQVITTDEEGFNTHSSISGKVMGRTNYKDASNNEVRCLVIENDYKELYEHKLINKKDISKYSKEEFIECIKETGIVGLGGAGFPTYKKYLPNNLEYLVINAVECEPLIQTDKTLSKEKIEEILEAIDAIIEINKFKKAIIVLKASNENLIDIINQYKGTYLNIEIELVSNKYPNGWERKIINDVLKTKYDKYPIEKNIVVNNVGTIFAIYEALKYKKPLIERVITISGNNIVNPSNILVKVGTSLNEIIPNLGGIKYDGGYLVSGSVMTGIALDNIDTTIGKNNNCFLCLTKQPIKRISCINCGKCTDNCPVGLSPVLIRKNINNIKLLKKLKADKCIECGLCSYICPSKIEIKEVVKDAKGRCRDV